MPKNSQYLVFFISYQFLKARGSRQGCIADLQEYRQSAIISDF
ncbi:MAG: hypothetical protein ACKPBT_09810 [Microcystis aeruginosa]